MQNFWKTVVLVFHTIFELFSKILVLKVLGVKFIENFKKILGHFGKIVEKC